LDASAKNPECNHNIINIGSGRATTGWEALATMTATASAQGIVVPDMILPPNGEAKAYPGTILDTTKSRSILGSTPITSLAELCTIVWDDLFSQALPPKEYLHSIFPQFAKN
jgi:nucleoside-diphosphate-sugar epimerase